MLSSLVESFPPQVAVGCRVLLLGTAPSLRSLAARQSYAHPQNFFWPLMGEFFGAGPELPYAQRIEKLHAAGLGIWDVLASCERPGSLDSNIVRTSEIANDIPALLAEYPSIRAIALNGGKAQQSFRRLIPQNNEFVRRVALLDLPSTSPANASITRDNKRERWRVVLEYLG